MDLDVAMEQDAVGLTWIDTDFSQDKADQVANSLVGQYRIALRAAGCVRHKIQFQDVAELVKMELEAATEGNEVWNVLFGVRFAAEVDYAKGSYGYAQLLSYQAVDLATNLAGKHIVCALVFRSPS